MACRSALLTAADVTTSSQVLAAVERSVNPSSVFAVAVAAVATASLVAGMLSRLSWARQILTSSSKV